MFRFVRRRLAPGTDVTSSTLTLARALEVLQFSEAGAPQPPATRLAAPALKAAYLRRALILHPDTARAHGADAAAATRQFQELNDALSLAMLAARAGVTLEGVRGWDGGGGATPTSSAASATAAGYGSSRPDWAVEVHRLAERQRRVLSMYGGLDRGAGGAAAGALHDVAASCALLQASAARANAALRDCAQALCGRRSFDATVVEGAGPEETLSIEQGVAQLLHVLPNVVTRVRRASRGRNADKGDIKDLDTATACGFGPLTLIGSLLLHPGAACGLAAHGAADVAAVVAAHDASGAAPGARVPGFGVHPDLTCVIGVQAAAEAQRASQHVTGNHARARFLDSVCIAFLHWQAASAARVRLEQRISVAAKLLAVELGGFLDALECPPDLARSNEDTRAFAEQLEAMVAAAQAQPAELEVLLPGLATAAELLDSSDGTLAGTGDAGDALSRRGLRRFVRSWSLSRIHVDGTSAAPAAARASQGAVVPHHAAAAGASASARRPPVEITRPQTACTAEEVQFDVAIHFTSDAVEMARRFILAVELLGQRTRESTELVPRIGAVRDACERDGVRCVGRVVALPAQAELRLWQQLQRRSELLAQHGRRISSMDVHLVGGWAAPGAALPGGDRAPVGWCESTHDGDRVTIDAAALESDAAFDQWLEDVVAQGTLSAQAQAMLSRFAIHNVRRHAALLLPHFLRFVARYVTSAARRVIESRAQGIGGRGGGGGFAVEVGELLGVRPDGTLLVPWDADPAVLLALLDAESTPHVALPPKSAQY